MVRSVRSNWAKYDRDPRDDVGCALRSAVPSSDSCWTGFDLSTATKRGLYGYQGPVGYMDAIDVAGLRCITGFKQDAPVRGNRLAPELIATQVSRGLSEGVPLGDHYVLPSPACTPNPTRMQQRFTAIHALCELPGEIARALCDVGTPTDGSPIAWRADPDKHAQFLADTLSYLRRTHVHYAGLVDPAEFERHGLGWFGNEDHVIGVYAALFPLPRLR